jgi:DNA-binding response OmpR family regulator
LNVSMRAQHIHEPARHAARQLKQAAGRTSGGDVSDRDPYPPLLLVEDGPLTLLSTRAALEEEGFQVVAVRHASAALAALAQPVRGLITDIRLPGPYDGWQIAQEARTRWANIPVIYVTGEGDADWPIKGVPGSLILQKPCSAGKLLATVAKLLAEKTTAPPRSS